MEELGNDGAFFIRKLDVQDTVLICLPDTGGMTNYELFFLNSNSNIES